MKKMTLSRDDHQREEIQMLGHLLQEPEKCSVDILLLFHKNWIIVFSYIAWHFIAFLTQPAVPDRHCQGTTIFDFFAKPYSLPFLTRIFSPHLQLRIDIVKEPREIFALQIFPELTAILHRATITLPLARPLGRFLVIIILAPGLSVCYLLPIVLSYE